MIHIFGGGTFSPVRNHLAICAPAFGQTARTLEGICQIMEHDVTLHLTKMADSNSSLITNADVAERLAQLVADPTTKMIIMNAALCDFDGSIGGVASGSHADRLKTSNGVETMTLTPSDKLIGEIRKTRKDIFVVGFKTTTNASPTEQYIAGLNLLKANSLNLVLANDTVTRNNMIIVPEEARYSETTERLTALVDLITMASLRRLNTFTRSTVVPGDAVSWASDAIPDNLRQVVDYCIQNGAYKPFRGSTVGHFALRVNDNEIITSKRKTNFNELANIGMVRCEYEGDDKVIAHGAKPSVGGQSQRIIFKEHPDMDCIVHFHCPMNKDVEHIPLVSQKPNECGSHQCGAATSNGLRSVAPGIKAVMLDNHGPNIVFSKTTPAQNVIDFIDQNFDLLNKTGGPVSLDNRTTGFTENMPAHLAKRFREEADKYIADRAE